MTAGNGGVHVLSASSDDPSRLETISSFKALNRAFNSLSPPTLQPLVSTWWRQSGKLCVGGDSDIVNVWDCPAERRDRVSLPPNLPSIALLTGIGVEHWYHSLTHYDHHRASIGKRTPRWLCQWLRQAMGSEAEPTGSLDVMAGRLLQLQHASYRPWGIDCQIGRRSG